MHIYVTQRDAIDTDLGAHYLWHFELRAQEKNNLIMMLSHSHTLSVSMYDEEHIYIYIYILDVLHHPQHDFIRFAVFCSLQFVHTFGNRFESTIFCSYCVKRSSAVCAEWWCGCGCDSCLLRWAYLLLTNKLQNSKPVILSGTCSWYARYTTGYWTKIWWIISGFKLYLTPVVAGPPGWFPIW